MSQAIVSEIVLKSGRKYQGRLKIIKIDKGTIHMNDENGTHIEAGCHEIIYLKLEPSGASPGLS